MDLATGNKHQGVALPTRLEATAWCCRCPGAAGLPTQGWEALSMPRQPAGARGKGCFAFLWQTLFYRLLWASGVFNSIVHHSTTSGILCQPCPPCNIQSDRDASRINLTDSTGLHPTWIWANVYS